MPSASSTAPLGEAERAIRARYRGVEDRKAVRAEYQQVADDIVRAEKMKRRGIVAVASVIGVLAGAAVFLIQRSFFGTTDGYNNNNDIDDRFVAI